MTCIGCGFANRDEARFCGNCGALLAREVRCDGCGRTSPAGRTFCDECGRPIAAAAGPSPRTYTPKHLADKILRARSALEGERKQVTVLFADVKGSMELAEQVDAEEWHRILDRFFHILSEGVHRFEGTINQYTGDGVMALFGAPIAHEDHAQRACFAALHLRDELRRYADELRVASGLNFSVRMGLNSGEVVVGKIGDDLRMDYTAQGPTVGLAARMEQLAEPGKVLLTQHTAALAQGYFQLRDLGPARIKGVSTELRIYELEAVGALRTRFDLSRQRGFSRFVGRADELQALESALEEALAGRFAVVGIVAEAGTGKSRLCHEFVQRCRGRGVEVHEGHALPHGKMLPLLPLLELLRSVFGIDARDSADMARQKIAGTVVLLDPEMQDKLPLWFDFLGVPDASLPLPSLEPEVRQAQLVAGIRHLVRARSRTTPRLLLIEDLHWLDDASDALLAALVDVLHASRTLLLLNFRPEYRAPWMERDAVPYRQIALRPLGAEAVELLLDDLLGSDPALTDLRQLVRSRTGGSPFFVEEVVRALFDAGILERQEHGAARLTRTVDDIQIPSTVQAVLAARIDRLPEGHKHVLQSAAVIGKTFSETLLRRALGAETADGALGDILDSLVRADFLHLESVAPEKEYAFRHPLTQEVAYRSQLADRRAPIHAAVARAIEAAHPQQVDEHAALLAHHWAGAGELLRAAEWHRRAAEWLGMRDRREMMRHWREVCDLTGAVAESPEALTLGVVARQRLLVNGVFVGMRRENVRRLFDEGIALAERLPLLAPQVLLRVSYGLTLLFAGAVRQSLAQMREVLQVADESQDLLLRYVARVSSLAPLVHSGQLLECIERADEALAIGGGDVTLGEGLTRFSPLGALLANRSQALIYLGRVHEVWPLLDRVHEIGRGRNDVELISMSHSFRAIAAHSLGDAGASLRWARQALEAAESVDSAQLRVGAYGTLGLALGLAGEHAAAIEALSVALTLMHETSTGLFLEPTRRSDRAELRMRSGDLAGARADLEPALAIAHANGARLALVQCLVAQARLRMLEGDEPGSEACIDEADALAESTGALSYRPAIHLERAALARRRGDAVEHRRQLEAAHAILTATGAVARATALEPDLAIAPS